jgi:hypothetical protein
MESPNFDELKALGTITSHLIITLLVLGYISVGLRLWARYRVTKSPGWDDVAMVATLLLFTTYCAFLAAIRLRVKNDKFFTEKSIRLTLTFVQLSEVFYILTTTLLKVSLGLFFLRVLTKKWQKLIFHITLGVGVFVGLFYFFIVLFQCGNPSHIADNLTTPGTPQCLPKELGLAMGYIYGIVNILADWTFVLIPITVLMDSELDRWSKISVSMIMGLGAIGSISSIMRLVYLEALSLNAIGALNVDAIKATIWATAEPGTGIIAASIAILRPLVRQVACEMRKQATSLSKSRNASNSDDSIALTNRISVTRSQASKKSSIDSIRSEDSPWSPAILGTANVQRMVVIQGGRASVTPEAMV